MDRVVINPSDVIRMPVLPLQACETKLRIDNNSDTAITYKVKTTQPKRYYVRPNQGVIAAHSSDEISIILVDKEVPDLLVSASEGIPDDSKDRFLVMYAPIDNEQYQRCAQVTSDADGGATGDERRVKEVASLWAPKEPASKVSKRLNVELRLPADLHAAVMQMEQGGKRDAVMDARNRIRGVEGREDHQSSSAAPMEQPPQLGEVQQSSKSPASSTTSTSTPHRGGAASNGQQQQQQASSSSSAAAPREKSSRRHHDDNKHSREGGVGGGIRIWSHCTKTLFRHERSMMLLSNTLSSSLPKGTCSPPCSKTKRRNSRNLKTSMPPSLPPRLLRREVGEQEARLQLLRLRLSRGDLSCLLCIW